MREIKLIEGDKQIGVIYKYYGDNLRLGAKMLRDCFNYVADNFSMPKDDIEGYMRELNTLVSLLHEEILGDGKFWDNLFCSGIFLDAIGMVEHYDKCSVEITFKDE